ncbi:uncharacterized protein N7482_005919 [Penicillium canariense]|uniref:Zn(2)-C6 fungal-type domain-containing protein n=1 Tax=Penicillium canariense TaxID=189055 RepID=A0A9W9LNX0_9EURO|nr:uncharacterized protein N7482_005919 [Penicillium canariense]KAJ5167138.1 hypothetical protein N7482_005919 [Penicillium canariense]
MSPVSKTCQSCANSKVRCVRTVESPHVCNRCLRLGRECVYRHARRRFNGFQKDRKIEALESRVRELMTDHTASSVDSMRAHSETVASNQSVSAVEDDDGDKDVIKRGFLSLKTAENYLESFKTMMTPHFPFVVIPQHFSAAQLREDKPFLFLAIMASASYEDMPLQRSLGAEVKKAVASRLIFNGEVSFDLLQGLLVSLAWSHYHTKPYRYTPFLQLAVSLIIDLRLDRPPQTKIWQTRLHFGPQCASDEQTQDRPSWGIDEKRAVIGCYYLSSTIAALLHKQPTFSYIPYIEECCQSLQNANESPHDSYITSLVQLQRIAEKIDHLSANHTQELMRPGSGSELYVTHIKSDLEAFQDRLSFDIYEAPFLAFHFHATGLSLYQLSLTLTGQQTNTRVVSLQPWWDEMLCAAMNASEFMLNWYISLPADTELGFTNTQWVQMAFAMVVLYRHTATLANPKQTAVFLDILAQLRQRVGALSTPHVDLNGDRDTFFDFRRRIVQIQSRFDVSSKDGSSSTDRGNNAPVNISSTPQADSVNLDSSVQDDLFTSIEFSHDYLFEASMEQIMGDWI